MEDHRAEKNSSSGPSQENIASVRTSVVEELKMCNNRRLYQVQHRVFNDIIYL